MKNQNADSSNLKDKLSQDLIKKISELEKKLSENDKEIQDLKKELYHCQGRLQEIREEKNEVNQQLKELEMMKMDLQLLDAQNLQDENHKIQHRIHVTKNLLDEARADLEFRAEVIQDLEDRGFIDYLFRRVPDNLIIYKKSK